MDNKKAKIISKVILILLGIIALIFQLVNFFFGTLVKSSSSRQSELSFYLNDFIPHLFTIFICSWFIVHQIKSLYRKEQ